MQSNKNGTQKKIPLLTFQQWFNGTRPKTLLVGISAVIIGISITAIMKKNTGQIAEAVGNYQPDGVKALLLSFLCLVVVVFLQIAVNFANDFSDGIRGTDNSRQQIPQKNMSASQITISPNAPTRLTASGVSPSAVLYAAIGSALIACFAGLGVVILTGLWQLLGIGVISIIALWFYTGGKHPYGYYGFGEVAVFIFFGLVPVMGIYYVLSNGGFSMLPLWASISQGLLSVVVMMINNLRDTRTDAIAGKRTLEVRIGAPLSRLLLIAIIVGGNVISLLIATQNNSVYGISWSIGTFICGLWVIYCAWTHQFARALSGASLVCLFNSMVYLFVALFA